MKDTVEGQLVPIEDVANHFKVSLSTTRKWVRDGDIPENLYVKIGKTYRFDLAGISKALLARSSTTSTTEEDTGVTDLLGSWAEEDLDDDVLYRLGEDWQKENRKDKTDGLSKKAVKAYRRENPGSKLQTAVTKDPKKLKKGSKSAKRRLSFCRRMKGMKKRLTSAKTARDPDSRINKALRRWNC